MSNGSPATAAPCASTRASGARAATSPTSAATTARGTRAPTGWRTPPRRRPPGRSAPPDRRGCRRSPRTAAPGPPGRGRPGAARRPPRVSGPELERRTPPWRPAASSASSRCGRAPVRAARASSTPPRGRRCSRSAMTSADAGSAQCTSSRSSVTGCSAAQRSAARDGAGHPVALDGGRGRDPRHAPGRRQRHGESASCSSASPPTPRRRAGDAPPERVDPERERHVALELGRAARHHEMPRSPARRPSSSSSRDLPMPGSPTIPSACGRPASTCASARSSAASSASRPTSGRTPVLIAPTLSAPFRVGQPPPGRLAHPSVAASAHDSDSTFTRPEAPKDPSMQGLLFSAPGRTRTWDPRLRRSIQAALCASDRNFVISGLSRPFSPVSRRPICAEILFCAPRVGWTWDGNADRSLRPHLFLHLGASASRSVDLLRGAP